MCQRSAAERPCSRGRETEAGFLQPLLSQGACAQLRCDSGRHETCQPCYHPNSDSPDLCLHLCGAPAPCWGLQEPFKTPRGCFALSLPLKASPQSHPRELRGHPQLGGDSGPGIPRDTPRPAWALHVGVAVLGQAAGSRGRESQPWPCPGRSLAALCHSHLEMACVCVQVCAMCTSGVVVSACPWTGS